MFKQHPIRFYIANAFLNMSTLKENKDAEKKEPAPATPEAAPDVAPEVAPEVTLGGSEPTVQQQLCLTVSRTGTQATFQVKETSECGASGFISDCSGTTGLFHGDPYNLIDYDGGSYPLNCYTNVGTSKHTVDTTSGDWQSISLGNNAFVYYNKDGWFVDQWTKQPSQFCSGPNGGYPSVLTPSISSSGAGIEPVSTTSFENPYVYAYQHIPFYAYTTTGAGFSSFYMTLTSPSGPYPTQNESATLILGIFRSDGTVTTYKNPEGGQTISISDASPTLTMGITRVVGYPDYILYYTFSEQGGSCPSGYGSTS